MSTLKDIGERGIIERLCRRLPSRPEVALGVGDDCAIVRPGATPDCEWLLTSDAVIEGTHFTGGASPAAVGHKAIGRVLSDLAAMGAEPRWALMDLAAPPHEEVRILEGIYEGATALAARHALAIVGGDTARADALAIHVFAVGQAPANKSVRRSGARKGDLVFVTGALGGSRRCRHLAFEPRVQEGIWLRDWAAALIDVSDGLAADLRHILDQSGVGATLDGSRIPVSADARELNDGVPPLDHALYDGEDFELLFTVRPDHEAALLEAWRSTFTLPCTCIGVMTDRPGVLECVGRGGAVTVLEEPGFRHF